MKIFISWSGTPLKVIEAPDTGCVLGYRDRTILEVLYATGIRKSEVRGWLGLCGRSL